MRGGELGGDDGVHTIRETRGKTLPCRPRSRGETCPHGRSLTCGKRHAEDDPCLGEALCPLCFDYSHAFESCRSGDSKDAVASRRGTSPRPAAREVCSTGRHG